MNFIANSICRGSRVEVTLLKLLLPIVNDARQIGLVWLKMLNVSARNWPPKRSVNLKFLNKPISVRQKPGNRTAPGRSVGTVVWPATGSAKAAALKYPVSKFLGWLELGSPIWFARK